MPRGGARIGAGRPKGALGYSRRAIHDAAQASGETPIAYMLRVMRDEKVPPSRRDRMAELAAPFFYSRMTPVPDISPEDAAAEAAAEVAEYAKAKAEEEGELAAMKSVLKALEGQKL